MAGEKAEIDAVGSAKGCGYDSLLERLKFQCEKLKWEAVCKRREENEAAKKGEREAVREFEREKLEYKKALFEA